MKTLFIDVVPLSGNGGAKWNMASGKKSVESVAIDKILSVEDDETFESNGSFFGTGRYLKCATIHLIGSGRVKCEETRAEVLALISEAQK